MCRRWCEEVARPGTRCHAGPGLSEEASDRPLTLRLAGLCSREFLRSDLKRATGRETASVGSGAESPGLVFLAPAGRLAKGKFSHEASTWDARPVFPHSITQVRYVIDQTSESGYFSPVVNGASLRPLRIGAFSKIHRLSLREASLPGFRPIAQSSIASVDQGQ